MVDLMIELREEQSQAIAGLPYLSLQLSPDVKVAVQLKFVRETLVLTINRFTQMPNVHPCLIGLVEHRSNVFWVLDLPQLLGFAPIDSTAIGCDLLSLRSYHHENHLMLGLQLSFCLFCAVGSFSQKRLTTICTC